MPQEFQILRCCECERFQVHHVKKAKKWQCKVCGQKQSMKRAFFIGSSRDCRVNVQKLNFQVGEQEMRRELDESCSSVGDNKIDSEVADEDADSSRENEPVENDWVDKSNGRVENNWVDEMDESDWVDGMDDDEWVDGVEENDWIDEADWTANNPSGILDNRNSESDCEDDLPRKKQRYGSDSGSQTVEENFIQPNGNVENQGYFSASCFFKSGNSSKQIDSAVTTSSGVPKTEREKECGSFQNGEENPLTEVVKPRTNSVLKPTRGFQLIFNEAKKQRTDLSYELDGLL